mgnify:CR=1 FL=1
MVNKNKKIEAFLAARKAEAADSAPVADKKGGKAPPPKKEEPPKKDAKGKGGPTPEEEEAEALRIKEEEAEKERLRMFFRLINKKISFHNCTYVLKKNYINLP